MNEIIKQILFLKTAHTNIDICISTRNIKLYY